MAGMSPDEVLSILLEVDTRSMDAATGSIGNWQSALNTGMGVAKAFIGTLAAVDLAIVGFGTMASKKAAEFDALALSLNAIEGSAQKASKAMAALREIAKGPGLGVESAIETYAGLRRGGLDSAFSMDLTKNLGNAIAFTGGGKDELSRIAIALNQIAVSPTLRGQDVMQLAQARLPVYGALKSAFGTADTAELDKMGISSAEALRAINEELAKLPKVAGGAKNTFENLADALDYGMIQIGQGINKGIIPFVNDLVSSIDKLNNSGNLEAYGSALADAFMSVMEAFTGSTETNDILRGIEKATLVVAYATSNLLENSRGLAEGIKNFWENTFGTKESPYITVEEWRARNPGKTTADMPNPYIRDGQWVVDDPNGIMPTPTPDTPAGQAEAKMREIEAEAERNRQTQENGRLRRDPNGGHYREIEVAPGVWIDERKATPAQRAAARKLKAQGGSSASGADSAMGGVTGSGTETPPGVEPPATKFLRQIEQHTREMKEHVQDMLLGGGAATDAAVNERNLARWSGTGSSNRFARMIEEGVRGLIIEGSSAMAKAGTFRRAT